MITPEEMLQFRHLLPLWKWTIVTGAGGEAREWSCIAPRAEDAIAMFRACQHPIDLYVGSFIQDMRCEPLARPETERE